MKSLLDWFLTDPWQSLGAVSGMVGAIMLAMNRPWSRWAWWIWLASNAILIAVLSHRSMWPMAGMQAVYLVTSGLGIRNTFFKHKA